VLQKKIRNFSLVNVDNFFFSGGHVGHLFANWYPNFGVGLKHLSYRRANFIFFNLNKTVFFLNKACTIIKQMAKRGAVLLYVGTTFFSYPVVRLAGIYSKISYIADLWVGGLLTNFKNVVYLPLKKINSKKGIIFATNSYINEKNKHLYGLKKLDFVPELVLCSSEADSPFTISEANNLLIPTIAVVDSNVRIVESTYPVVLNDDSSLVFKNLFFIFSSSFWFGRADFAMSYLCVMHKFILDLILFNIKIKNSDFKKFQKWFSHAKNISSTVSPTVKDFLRSIESL
jgi:small subunit ribosomal protein S2